MEQLKMLCTQRLFVCPCEAMSADGQGAFSRHVKTTIYSDNHIKSHIDRSVDYWTVGSICIFFIFAAGLLLSPCVAIEGYRVKGFRINESF